MLQRWWLILVVALTAGAWDARRAIHAERTAAMTTGPTLAFASSAVAAGGTEDTGTLPRPQSRAPQEQVEAYRARRDKSVVELQQFRQTTRLAVANLGGSLSAVDFIDLNPRIGAWYLLQLESADGSEVTYHLETSGPARVRLDPSFQTGLLIEAGGGDSRTSARCELWPAGAATLLETARKSSLAYAPLCGGKLFLRNAVEGHRTSKERVADLVRDHVAHGEEITTFVKDVFYRDAYLETSGLAQATVAAPREAQGGPARPLVDPDALDRPLTPVDLELPVEGEQDDEMAVGRWYPAQGSPGIYVTTLRPDVVSPEIVEEQKGRVTPLDAVESEALVYLVAFDLSQFDLRFRLGTDHPRVGWSDMVQPPVRDDALAGPDGIATTEPLVRTGMLSPSEVGRVAASFTGGFKRTHGAFKVSDLATVHDGSHYGFVEDGVVMSKLQPGLATAVIYDDGRIDLKTWRKEDDADLARVRYARQNGVAILERDERSGRIVPGARVRQWGAGNWSGSVDKKLRTVRTGLCLQELQGNPFLVFGYFSSATPSAMARVFQASQCRYAMLLDMNALEHTYMAVYPARGADLLTDHLIKGMDVVDGSKDGKPLPRFVSVADNRDFFYLLRRGRP